MSDKILIERRHINQLATSLPNFFHMKTACKRLDAQPQLKAFYSFLMERDFESRSQLFQDVFVEFIYESERNLKFLEFGATDGSDLSNTLMLETSLNWRGVLSEPDPYWHQSLHANRPNATIITDCIYSASNQQLKFVSSASHTLSGLKEFSEQEIGKPTESNAIERMREFHEIIVGTMSLNDVFEKFFDGKPIEYASIDTEGSELKILMTFDFDKYHPGVFTVEHNHTNNEKLLDQLFKIHGYTRIFPEITAFDAWYVCSDLALKRGLI